MFQLKTETFNEQGIPVIAVYPPHPDKKAVILYHGWSSSAGMQISRAALLAVYGYTVFIPEAVHHGKRQALTDYYKVDDYPVFWETIFQNIEEYPALFHFTQKQGYETPVLMGHSMGGLSVLGIGAHHKDKVKRIVSFNGSGNWILTHLFLQARFGIKFDDRGSWYKKLEDLNPDHCTKSLKNIPILLINGENDQSIDPRAQENFYQHLMLEGGKAEHIVYPLQGHGITTNMIDDALQWIESADEK